MNAVRKYSKYPVVMILIVCMLTNGLSLSFSSEVFAHELDHIYQKLPADPATHLEMHRNIMSQEGVDLDTATHSCLHSAGQYQPFFFNSIPQIPTQVTTETLVVFLSSFIPETIPDLLLRPPRVIA
ncbi:MAG: hypothetical protein DYH15_08425 [Nitrosomonas sp. PRO4]|nr:hypothetical protein [Nitrosomonas sp. PRO4]